MTYNFKLGPESLWLVVNTVLGALVTTLVATDFTSITDWKAWAIGFGLAALRTALGAILAAATPTGSFGGSPTPPQG